MGNLGGRATISQIDGYTDMFYTAGDLGDTSPSPTSPVTQGNDIGLLNASAWEGATCS